MGGFVSNTTAWLIRHGQSTANLGTWSCDPNDIILTEKGYRQALAIADQITTRPDLIISSPMQRALQTAASTRNKWADVPVEIWPIQEFSYLSPPKYQTTTADERKKIIHDYWQKAIPAYCDGEHSESFSDFINRVEAFHRELLKKNGFIVIFGHGQFFKAFLLGYRHGFSVTPAWMTLFRQCETAQPILNGEIIPWPPEGSRLTSLNL